MYHPRHRFSCRAPPCDHSRTHRHGPPHCHEYLDIIDMLHGFDLHNVAELEHVLHGAHMGDRQCIDFETELEIMEYNYSVLAHYHLLSPAWLDDHDPLMGLPMDGGRYGGGDYIPSGAPGHHHHAPGHNHYGPGHHHHGPRPSSGRDGRGVPYVEDTGSEASVFPGYRAAQASGRNQGRRGARQPIDRDEEDRYETSPPPRRGGRRRHDEDEDEVEGSESDGSAPPPRRAGGGRTRRDPSPEVSERRERVGARSHRDKDEDSNDSPPLPPRRRAGGNAKAEERRARVEHTGQTNMHWQPGALRFEDVQELESEEEEEEEKVKPVKAMKKGGKSGGGAKEGKGKPRDRY